MLGIWLTVWSYYVAERWTSEGHYVLVAEQVALFLHRGVFLSWKCTKNLADIHIVIMYIIV